jgi:hypothetical protein
VVGISHRLPGKEDTVRKIYVSSLVLLALAASTVAPGYTADLDQATETQADLPVDEPLMTPVEDPEIPDLVDPGRDWEEKIRACEPWEAQQYCGPGCDCVITVHNVYCFC